MAVPKTIRSNPSAQPARRRTHPQTRINPQTRTLQMNDPQLKAQLFDTLHRLNRGFGVGLAALDRLQKQDRRHKPAIFPTDCILNYRDRTEALRALINRDLLRLFAGHEEREAEQFYPSTK